MASIYKRKNTDGKSFSWRAVIRINGFPTTCKTFDRKQEAEDWSRDTENQIKLGQFKFHNHRKQNSYKSLVERMHLDGVLAQNRSYNRVKSQYEYWKKRLGSYSLIHITPEIIVKERQLLMDTPADTNKPRSGATINRYMAVLSSTFSYAVKRLRWINDNPCSNLLKVKASSGRDRVLTDDEVLRLLQCCRQSKSPYLYCIVLIAVTTGARRGEILGLEWKHIDFENQIAFLKETKNGRPRSIFLVPEVLEELKKLQTIRKENAPLIFSSKTCFGKIDIKKSWMEALKRAEIHNACFHTLRHTFCTNASGLGASNIELACGMGHRTLSMLQKYSHLDVRMTQKFSKAISERLLVGACGK